MRKYFIMAAIAIFSLSMTACDTAKTVADEVGKAVTAQGREYDNLISASVGETTTNTFFEWTLSSAWISYDIDGYTPPDGYMFVVAEISTTNISYDNNLPMGSADYIIAWGSGEEDWDYSLEEFTDGMYPDEEVLEVKKTIEGILVFLVPDGLEDVSIIYDEVYEDEFVGNTYSYDIILPEYQEKKL